MHDVAVYVKEGLPFALDFFSILKSLENSADSYLCFQLALLSFLFSLYWYLRLCAQFWSCFI